MTKKTNSKLSSFHSRVIKRSFSTSLVMAALATLAACDGSHINDEAHLKAVPSSHASPKPSPKTSLDEGQEMFAYLDESELIDAYYEVK